MDSSNRKTTFSILILTVLFSSVFPYPTWETASLDKTDMNDLGIDITGIQKVEDEMIEVSWAINSTAKRMLSGFSLSYEHLHLKQKNDTTPQHMEPSGNDEETNSSMTKMKTDAGLRFESMQLPLDVRSLSLHLPSSCRSFRICVHAVYRHDQIRQGQRSQEKADNDNNSTSLGQSSNVTNENDSSDMSCVDWSFPTGSRNVAKEKEEKKKKNDTEGQADDEEDEEEEDTFGGRKLIVGVSAGCIFLIPCVVVLILIVQKDKKMRLTSMYEELGQGHLNGGLELDEEGGGEGGKGGEKESLRKGDRGDRDVGGGRNEGEKEGKGVGRGAVTEWRSLSVAQLKAVKGPTIYVHSVDEDSGSESSIRGGVFYNERF